MSLNQAQSEMKFSSESPATNGILESQAKSNNDGTVCNTSSQNTCWVKLNVGGKVNNVHNNKIILISSCNNVHNNTSNQLHSEVAPWFWKFWYRWPID